MVRLKTDRLPFDPGPAAWDKVLPPAHGYRELEEKRTSDWLVIGAGFAGLSAARRLRQLHPKDAICVLEARRIAEGPAGRNSGFMIDLPHNLASDDYAGALDADRMQTEMNRAAITFAENAKDEFGMPEEALIRSGKINAAATQRGQQHNLDYARHLNSLDEHCELLDSQQMRGICGSNYYRHGLYTPGTAMLQPALYVRGLGAGSAKAGVDIFESSPVRSLSRQGDTWQAETPKGRVEAPKVILAVNGHAESFGLFKRRLMHIYLYASMTRRLSDEECRNLGGQERWALTPADPMGTTVRRISGSGGTRIVVRNRFTWAPSRQVSQDRLKNIRRVHDKSFFARFPGLAGVEMEYCWGGLLCLSWNGVSAFGEVETGLYSACCQNGLGAAKGTSNGILAAELASGLSSQHLDFMLADDRPRKLPAEPFSSLGANAYLRWAEYRAGAEL